MKRLLRETTKIIIIVKKIDLVRHFDFYCMHHLKSSDHVYQFKDWYTTVTFPESTWFIDNLKYVRDNTYENTERVINNYLEENGLIWNPKKL